MATHICKSCGSAFTHNYRGRPPLKCSTCRAANGQEISNGNRPNRFAGSCVKCGQRVAEQAGYAVNINGGWKVTHKDACPAIAIDGNNVPEVPKVKAEAMGIKAPAGTVDAAIGAMIEAMTANVRVDTDGIKADVLSYVDSALPNLIETHGVQRVEIVSDGVKVPLPEVHHKALPTLILTLKAGLHVFMPGPAGSGKSTLAMQAADAMEMAFGSMSVGPTTPTSKLFGYMDANGNYVSTEFRKVYEGGGIFLLDEMDNGHPGLLAEMNQALANPYCAFADAMVKRHPDFRMVATGNTFGRGPDRLFVGRNILDAATLDRFYTLEVAVDERMERRIASAYVNADDETLVTRWIDHVQSVRRKATAANLPVVVSPRATIDGAKLLAMGMDWEQVEEGRLFAGIKSDVRSQLV